MRIVIRRSPGWPRATLDLARRRLEFALGRFAGHVRSLSLRLTDLNGPRGGEDKRCVLAVRLERPRRVILIEDVDADGAAVIGRAAERARRAVARAVDSAGDWRSLPGPAVHRKRQ